MEITERNPVPRPPGNDSLPPVAAPCPGQRENSPEGRILSPCRRSLCAVTGPGARTPWRECVSAEKKPETGQIHPFHRNIQIDKKNTSIKDMYPFLFAGTRGVYGKEAAARIISRRVSWFLQAVLLTIGILAGAAVTCADEAGGPGSTPAVFSCTALPTGSSTFFCPDR